MRILGVKSIFFGIFLATISVFAFSSNAQASDRYWVGGTGNWSDTSHWATSSGGTGGAAAPTSADNCYFDANSFLSGGTTTVDTAAYCQDIDWTGATNSPKLYFAASNNLSFYGNATFISAMTVSSASSYASYGLVYSGTGSQTLTTNGLSLGCRLIIYHNAGTLSLQDDLTITQMYTGALTVNSNFTTNNHNVTVTGGFARDRTDTATMELGTSRLTFGNGWHMDAPTGMTVNQSASGSIVLTGTSMFTGGGLTYYEVQLSGSSHAITGSNTFTNLIASSSITQVISFATGSTQTITGLATLSGSSGKIHTLTGNSSSTWSIVKSGGGTINLDYVNIAYSSSSPAGTWNAGPNSTDGGNNSGWRINGRYWVGGTGNWSDATNHWATSSGGTPGASNIPTTTTNCYFDANSFPSGGTTTIDTTAYCQDMDWTGATNSPRLARGSGQIYIYGNLTFIAAMSVTASNSGSIQFKASGSLTTNGLVVGSNISINSGASTLTLADNLDIGTNSFLSYGGTVNTANKTVTCGDFHVQYTPNTIMLGSSIVNCTSWSWLSGTTLNASTSSIRITGTGAFSGGGLTYYEVQLNGTAHTVSGSNTFTNLIRNGTNTKTDTVTFTSGTTQTVTGSLSLAGTSSVNRLLVQSSTLGSPATLNVTGNWTGTQNVDFMDITATNPVDLSSITGLSGDCQGNTNITFTASSTQNWGGDTGSWSDATKWLFRVPLPQDDVSAGGTGNTITIDMPRIGKNITFTGTPTVTQSNAIDIFGSFTLLSGMTYVPSSPNYQNFRGRNSYTITLAGKTLVRPQFYAAGGTYTLQDAMVYSTGQAIWLLAGTLNTNNQSVTGGAFYASGSTLPRSLIMGSSTFTMMSASGYTFHCITATNLTIDAGTSNIVLTNSTAGATSFNGGSLVYNNVTVQGSGNYALTITGSNTFNNFSVDRSAAAKTITFATGTTQTFSNFVATTSGTTVLTLNTNGSSTASLVKSGSSLVNLEYLNLSYLAASPASTWYAGNHSTDGGNNTGWTFSGLPGRYWVGGTGNWSATSSWATSSGGTPGASVPTSADNCYFDASSFSGAGQTLTVDATAYCQDMDWTGATNTPTLASTNQQLLIYGNTTFISAMATTKTGDSYLSFRGSGSLTTNGLTLNFNNVGRGDDGITYTLNDDVTVYNYFWWYKGTLNTNNKTINCAEFNSNYSTTRTINFGSSTINCTSWNIATVTGLTLNSETSIIKITGTGAFSGGGLTYYEVQLNGSSHTIYGNNTFTNLIRNGTSSASTLSFGSSTTQTITGTLTLNGASSSARLLVQTDGLGSSSTVSAANVSIANTDLMDIKAAGAASWDFSSQNDVGDAGGNYNITFPSSQAHYWVATSGGNWNATSSWATSSGGTPGAYLPLPQDDVYFDANSITSSGKTITVNMYRLGRSIDFTNVANSPTVSLSNNISNYGSFVFTNNLTLTNDKDIYFRGRSNYFYTSAGKSFNKIYIAAVGGSLTLSDNETSASAIRVIGGTFNTNNYTVSAAGLMTYPRDASTPAAINLGSSVVNLTGLYEANILLFSSNANFSFDAGSSTINLNRAGDTTITSSGLTYYNLVIGGANSATSTFTGSNTFNTLSIDRSQAAKTIKFTSGTTQTVNNFVATTSGTTLITLQSSGASAFTLAKAGGGVLDLDYLSIASSTASPASTWYAGNHSTNGGNNSGWTFTDAPTAPDAPSSLGPASLVDGSYTSSTTPTLTFIQTDSDATDTVKYTVQVSTSSTYSPTVINYTSSLAATGSTSYTVTTPLSDGSYYWRVMSTDSYDATSSWTQASSNVAFIIDSTAPTVSISSVIANSSSSITVYATATDSGIGLASSPYYFSGWQADSSTTYSGLAPNTQYDYSVKARDSLNNESNYSATSSVYTLAALPGNLALSVDSSGQITAAWSSSTNPTSTEYYCENITASTNSGWILDLSWVSSSLACNTSYSFKVKARNADNEETSYVTLVTAKTDTCCGDGVCNGSENCSSCQQDCGGCGAVIIVPQSTSFTPTVPPPATTTPTVIEKITEVIKKIPEIFTKKEEPSSTVPAIEDVVKNAAQPVFQSIWTLIDQNPIDSFVFSPLPEEFQNLVQKFPELENTFEELGIDKISDIEKLQGIKLTLPGLTERLGLNETSLTAGQLVFPGGIPLADLSAQLKEEIPSEIVFAKTGGELVDLSINLTVSEDGTPKQTINTISGKPLSLAIKPEAKVKGIKGYLIFNSRSTTEATSTKLFGIELPVNYFLGSVVSSLAQTQTEPIEQKLVLEEFDYTDDDNDGIWTASIVAPQSEGQYEIVTVLDYKDVNLGKKEVRLITVVDPEGYVFAQMAEGKLRIEGATVSLYWLNTETSQYELWPAEKYQQENPQTTDDTGKYSFLVPQGKYYLKVEAQKYQNYQSEPFDVLAGGGVHMNIELQAKNWWLKIFDWKTILLIMVLILLAYNFYRDRTRERK